MFGGQVLTDLPGQVFADETPLYGGSPEPFLAADRVLDGLGAALGGPR
jgi:hypothetical protein